jgi:hypothetical protein
MSSLFSDGHETSVTGVAVLVDLERQSGVRHFGWEGLAFPSNYLDGFRLSLARKRWQQSELLHEMLLDDGQYF